MKRIRGKIAGVLTAVLLGMAIFPNTVAATGELPGRRLPRAVQRIFLQILQVRMKELRRLMKQANRSPHRMQSRTHRVRMRRNRRIQRSLVSRRRRVWKTGRRESRKWRLRD